MFNNLYFIFNLFDDLNENKLNKCLGIYWYYVIIV